MTSEPTCPRCGATSVQAVSVAKRSVGQALLAEMVLDSTAAGVIAGSKTVIVNACLICGMQWVPGTEGERRMRALSGQLGDIAKRAEEDRIAAEQAAKAKTDRTARIAGLVLLVVLIAVAVYALIQSEANFCKPSC